MIEQFNFDIRLIFAILNGKVSAAINRKLYRNFRQNGLEISPNNGQCLFFYGKKDGVTQQELCNATFKDKPSMTRLIDNMERQHLVVRISDKKDRRTNLIHLTKDGKGVGRKGAYHSRANTERGTPWYHPRRTEYRAGSVEKGILQHERLNCKTTTQFIKSTKSCLYNGFFIQIISPVKELCFNL